MHFRVLTETEWLLLEHTSYTPIIVELEGFEGLVGGGGGGWEVTVGQCETSDFSKGIISRNFNLKSEQNPFLLVGRFQ